MTIQAIIMACVLPIMNLLYDSGNALIGYYGMIIALVISFFTIFSMRNVKDANEADREYGQKEIA